MPLPLRFVAAAFLVSALLASFASAAPPDVVEFVLGAHRAAVGDDGRPGTLELRYAYAGQGLTGTTHAAIDRVTGAYVEGYEIGPTRGGSGYDGRMPWMQDISGACTPQDGGDRPANAVSAAYRNANLWWRADRGGAVVTFKGRETDEGSPVDHLTVAPRGGTPFDAWFDAGTHLLVRVVQPQQFFTITTRYRDFRREHGIMLAHTVVVDSGMGPEGIETTRLTSLSVEPARPMSAYARPADAPGGATLDDGASAVTVPIRLANNHIYVDARVNGKGPFPFLVDTGGHTILTPSTLAAVGLHAEGASPSAGAGEKTTTNGFVKVREISIGGMRLRDQTAFALEFASKEIEGLQVGGMMGFELFRRFAVRIDYGALTMTIVDPRRFDAADAGTAIPFRYYDHLPQVDGSFDGMPARFDIDTGSRSEVTLTTPFVERMALRESYPHGVLAVDGWGVGGPVKSYVVRGKTLMLGTVTVSAPVTSLSTARRGSFSDANYEGNIGSGLLKRFVVTFDYAHQRMYLKPLATPPDDAGTFDKSGMWINLAGDGFVVADVAKGGAAEAAGIVAGDVIAAIDGRSADEMTLSDARRLLRTRPDGTIVTADLIRGGVRSSVALTLHSRL